MYKANPSIINRNKAENHPKAENHHKAEQNKELSAVFSYFKSKYYNQSMSKVSLADIKNKHIAANFDNIPKVQINLGKKISNSKGKTKNLHTEKGKPERNIPKPSGKKTIEIQETKSRKNSKVSAEPKKKNTHSFVESDLNIGKRLKFPNSEDKDRFNNDLGEIPDEYNDIFDSPEKQAVKPVICRHKQG